ncbi:hypothetical protein CYMTET_26161 [Cymbomonas tetramitiformis]|uniref:Guanylate cyclase domain-containing protein n=1 Tax=Cymbomonas tetramitiformis TaxID=36881 RepID=A0AAE0FSM2_9CHLO|nr:hypothetical protein CYMTET_26161 [Cymbomonas tetramitiformis]
MAAAKAMCSVQHQEQTTVKIVELAHNLIRVSDRLSRTSVGKKKTLNLQIGIHSGPVHGGVVGATRRFYRLVGDTVNTAARLCRQAPRDHVHLSSATKAWLEGSDIMLSYRGTTELAGQSFIHTYTAVDNCPDLWWMDDSEGYASMPFANGHQYSAFESVPSTAVAAKFHRALQESHSMTDFNGMLKNDDKEKEYGIKKSSAICAEILSSVKWMVWLAIIFSVMNFFGIVWNSPDHDRRLVWCYIGVCSVPILTNVLLYGWLIYRCSSSKRVHSIVLMVKQDGHFAGILAIGFNLTPLSHSLSSTQLVELMHELWCMVDVMIDNTNKAIEQHRSERSKLNSDSLPFKVDNVGDVCIAQLLLDDYVPEAKQEAMGRLLLVTSSINQSIREYQERKPFGLPYGSIQLKMGLNFGPVLAGVVGTLEPHYHIFGDVLREAVDLKDMAYAGEISISSSIIKDIPSETDLRECFSNILSGV